MAEVAQEERLGPEALGHRVLLVVIKALDRTLQYTDTRKHGHTHARTNDQTSVIVSIHVHSNAQGPSGQRL